MQVRCSRCRQTAPKGCQKQLCGRCCVPPCAPDIHNVRTVSRGVDGQHRRKRTRQIWQKAEELVSQFYDSQMHRMARTRRRLSAEAAQTICNKALNLLVRRPDLTIDSDEIDPLLLCTFPPAALTDVVSLLRADFPEGVPETDAPEQSQRPPATTSSGSASGSQTIPAEATSGSLPSPAEEVLEEVTLTPVSASTEKSSVFQWWPESAMAVRLRAEHHFELPLPQSKGFGPKDKEGEPCSHYERSAPPLFQLLNTPIDWQGDDRMEQSAVTNAVLRQWIALRPDLMLRLEPPTVVQYPWYDTEGREITDLHDVGRWYYFKMKEWLPAPPRGVDVAARAFAGEPLTETIHSASMYTVLQSVVHGLKPGPKPGKKGLTGVYVYRNVIRKIATSSSGYAVYSDLAHNGIFFAPRYQVFFSQRMFGDAGKAYSAGDAQCALAEGMYYVAGLYIHAVTRQQILARAPKVELWFNCDRWHPEMELPVASVPTGEGTG